MKHIETPIRASLYNLYEADGHPLGMTFYRRDSRPNMPHALGAAAEIVQAVNAYDALVEACECQQIWKRHTEQCVACGLGLDCGTYRQMEQQADELTSAALAQVEEAQ